MDVIIDNIRYVPEAEVNELKDEVLRKVLYELTSIQYFDKCSRHKHRAWAWDALNAISPDIADMCSNDPRIAYDYVRRDDPYYNEED